MRVVYDVSYIQRRVFGIGRSSRELLRALLQCGAAHRFLLHGWSWSLDKRAIRDLAGEETSVSLHRIPGPVKRFYWNSLKTPRLETVVGDFDLFHSADPSLPPTREKTIATVHDFAYFRHPELFPFDARAYHRRILHWLTRADGVIVPSDFTLAELKDIAPQCSSKAFVVPWPVGPQFTPGSSAEWDADVVRRFGLQSPYVLFVGTLEPRKNLGVLLDAMEFLWKEDRKDLKLVVAGGGGWMNAALLKRLSALQTGGRLRLLGHVPEEDLPGVYRQAEVLVYPSLYEGFGLPVLEAMAAGLPVITSDTSALKEVGGDAASLVDPQNPRLLADALRRYTEDPSYRRDMRRKSLARAATYTAQSAVLAVNRVYDSL